MQKPFILVILLISLIYNSAFAISSANVDNQTIGIDEMLQLSINSDQVKQLRQKDIKALQAEFDIVNRHSSYNFSMVNGSFQKSYAIVLYLQAKRTGIITIPSFTLGNEKTKSIDITVTQNSTNNSGTNNNTALITSKPYIETVFDKNDLYVQEQLIVSWKLFSPYPILESKLEPFDLPHASLLYLDNIEYTQEVNAQEYYVHEYRFAIFPKRSGNFELHPISIKAAVNKPNTSAYSRYRLNYGEQIKVTSPEALLTVKPIPSTLKQDWLPANNVKITQAWSNDINSVRVGDTLIRTIQLEAMGVLPEHLSPLILPEVPNLKQYLDPEEKTQGTRTDGANTILKQAINLIPTQAGEYILDPIKINWWDSQKKQVVSSILPQQRIQVLDAQGNITQQQHKHQTPQAMPTNDSNKLEHVQAHTQENKTSFLNLALWFLLAIATLIVLGLLFLLFKKFRQTPQETKKHQQASLDQLMSLSRNDSCSHSQQTIITWARQYWPSHNVNSLFDIAELISTPERAIVQRELNLLQKNLYSAQDNQRHWNPQKFLSAIKIELEKKTAASTKQSKTNDLPSLYR